MRIDRDFAPLTMVIWSFRVPTLTDLVGTVLLRPGQTIGTSYQRTFGKCLINQNTFLEH